MSSSYASVPPAEVTVMVVANLYLVPSTAYVMTAATVKYHAEQIKSNKIHHIPLPHLQYYLAVKQEETAQLMDPAKR